MLSHSSSNISCLTRCICAECFPPVHYFTCFDQMKQECWRNGSKRRTIRCSEGSLSFPNILRWSWCDSSPLQLIYLPPPWGDCKATAMDSDFFDSYSITACRIDCETRYLMDNCNCRMVHMPGRKPSRVLYRTSELQTRMWTCVSCAPGDAPYCTPELYKECAHPALGENKKALFAPALSKLMCLHLTPDGPTFLGQSRNFAHCRFSGGERQRLLRVWDAVQHDSLQQGAVLRQDPQQGVR